MLRDDARNHTVPESSIIIEYLAQYYPGKAQLVPGTRTPARQTRLRDRFFDLHVHVPMQKVITDRLRPEGKNDPHGVEDARALIKTALGMIEEDMAAKTWAMGEDFSMADCAAAPALFYTNMIVPLAGDLQEYGCISGSADEAAVLCARSQGGRALSHDGAEGEGLISTDAQSSRRYSQMP